jgi:ORF 12 gene product N-terminal
MNRTDELGHVRAWSPRSALMLGLAGVFLAPMATVAMASTGDGPPSAIPQKALDRILNGQAPEGRHGSVKLAAAQVAIPRTPAGAQLAWLLAEVNGGSATLAPPEVRAHVSRRFLAALPAGSIVQLLKGSTTAYGPLELTGISGRSTAAAIVATVTARAHRKLTIRVEVAAGAQHSITGLDISDAHAKNA